MSWIARLVEKKVVIFQRFSNEIVAARHGWILLNPKNLELDKEYADRHLQLFYREREKGVYLYLYKK